ncbi:uncharacterized protein [Littorina saxatilis]|uniref:Ig-like domain-containing protein n=1 Tax=Littorina saxatilis TaxID=31220 RepID=A0AAN9GN93_9CAEN
MFSRGICLCYCVVSFFSLSKGQGLRLEPCEDGVFEIVHNSTNNSITCHSGNDNAGRSLTWTLKSRVGVLNISECSEHRWRCSIRLDIDMFEVTPKSTNSSTLVVNTIHSNMDVPAQYVFGWLRSLFDNGTILCTDKRFPDVQEARCATDYIRLPQGVSCSVTLSTATSPWTLAAHCDVSKVFSAMGRYSCRLMLSTDGSSVALGSATNMTTEPIKGDDYVSGSCNMTSILSASSADPRFFVEITPGKKEYEAKRKGTHAIRVPTSATLSHNCSSSVAVGDDIGCTCFAIDAGSPAGLLQWNVSKSDLFLQRNVRREDNGREFTCNLLWNGAIIKSTTFKLNVLYPPLSPLKYNCPPYVIEGSDLDCSCNTSDVGNPPGKLWWNVTKSAQLLRHNIHRNDAGTSFTCNLEWNGNTVKSKMYTLSVVSDSESVQQAHARGLATGVGSVLAVGVLVLVLVSVLLWRRGWVLPEMCSRVLPCTAASSGTKDKGRQEARADKEQPQVVSHTENEGAKAEGFSNVYDTTDVSQIGLQSPYEVLPVKYKPTSAQKKSRKRSGQKKSLSGPEDEGTTYENVQMQRGH